jgi:hypothetical protein
MATPLFVGIDVSKATLDTVLGAGDRACALSLVERCTGYLDLGQLPAAPPRPSIAAPNTSSSANAGPCAPSPPTMGPSSTATPPSIAPPAPASTSPRPITPGSAAPTRTPTACTGSTSPRAPAWPISPSGPAKPSPASSTPGPANASVSAPRRNAMPLSPDRPLTGYRGQRCTSQLISKSGRSSHRKLV